MGIYKVDGRWSRAEYAREQTSDALLRRCRAVYRIMSLVSGLSSVYVQCLYYILSSTDPAS